jgi:hypothetical protein
MVAWAVASGNAATNALMITPEIRIRFTSQTFHCLTKSSMVNDFLLGDFTSFELAEWYWDCFYCRRS